jgi:hypothetical protein
MNHRALCYSHALPWGHAACCPLPVPQGGLCRQCHRPRRTGWVTCGRSECQQAEARANAQRNKRKKRVKKEVI